MWRSISNNTDKIVEENMNIDEYLNNLQNDLDDQLSRFGVSDQPMGNMFTDITDKYTAYNQYTWIFNLKRKEQHKTHGNKSSQKG